MKTFTLNGKSYKGKDLDFNDMCDLEDMGVSVSNISEKNLSLVRGYLAISAGMSKEEAGEEIMNHIKSGEKLDNITEVMEDAIKNSEFFQSLRTGAEEEVTENPTEEGEKEENTTP